MKSDKRGRGIYLISMYLEGSALRRVLSLYVNKLVPRVPLHQSVRYKKNGKRGKAGIALPCNFTVKIFLVST